MWYCKACWKKTTPSHIRGPFDGDDAHAMHPSEDNGASLKDAAELAPDKKAPETVAAPSLNDVAKKAHWAQVFATFQQIGSSSRAMEYAQSLKKLRSGLQDLFTKYKDGLSQEDMLLQTAYTEALEAYKTKSDAQLAQGADQQLLLTSTDGMVLDDAYKQAIDMQVAAHQKLEDEALEMQRSIQGAHHKADLRQKEQEVRTGRRKQELPRRACVDACKFFMKTGDCAYGQTCKWDHPTEKLPAHLLRPGSNQPGMEHS